MKISDRSKKLWRNRFIVLGVIVAGVLGYVIYINSFTIYSFGHLTLVQDFGVSQPFVPASADNARVPGMVLVTQTEHLAMYINELSTNIAILDLRNNHIWYANPPGAIRDSIANPHERGTMQSHAGFRFFNEARRRNTRGMWLYQDSIYHEQFEIFSIPGGVRIVYELGSLDIGIDALPFLIIDEVFEERVLDQTETAAELRFVRQFWHPSRDYPGFWQMTEGIRDSVINTGRMLEFFYGIGWTYYDTLEALEVSGTETEIDFDTFLMTIEFILEGDRLIANLPLSEFTTNTPAFPDVIDFMKFFGAGGMNDEGFILVPSGTGGVINFNNGKHREDPFMQAVYGMDSLINVIRPQVVQPVRLPVFGIRNENAAFVAHVYSGSGIATINADVAGRANSYNHAWFSFSLRSASTISMAGVAGNMTVIQEEVYEGDITIIYHFIAVDNPGVADMAAAYQRFLVEENVLTPLQGPGDRSFYLDVVGAIDVQRHFVGVPYVSTQVMTTMDDAVRFTDILADAGVNTVQMQLHGWFNRGINHDVASNVRMISGVGSSNEMHNLNTRLQSNGGGLHPAVNFQLTNFYSRNISRQFETAKDLAGYIGFISRVSRDTLTTRFSHHRNDWYLLIHPGALPFHVDGFLPAFDRRLGLDGLALTDLGDVLTESLFRRDPVNRESARLIVTEQMRRIHEEIPNLVVFGGNDYSLRFASHIVDAPVRADWHYIIDYEVPFFPMVVHGFIEFAGAPANLMEHFNLNRVLLNSMATGASPRYTFTAEPTRLAQFSPHERLYSTEYTNWMDIAIEHYSVFNEVHSHLRAERIVGFTVLAGSYLYVGGEQVTVTEFSNGTRIYVNHTSNDFETEGFIIPANWFVVTGGVCCG